MITKIRNAAEYGQIMNIVENYIQKATQGGGFHTLNAQEANELQHLSLLAETWEDGLPAMPISSPVTLPDMIELKMYQMKLKQKELADLLEISPSRLSEVLKGKRKINLELARRLHQKLNIDATFLLNAS